MRRRNFLQVLAASLALAGCGGSDETPSSLPPSFVPPSLSRIEPGVLFAFDAQGGRYEVRGGRLTRFDALSASLWSVAGLLRPVAVAVDPTGVVWVLERSPGQLRRFSSDGTFLDTVGSFRVPQDVAISADRVYVSEAVGRRVSVLDLTGAFRTSFTDPDLDYPRGLALNSSGELHVVSAGRRKVLIFGPDGGRRATYGSFAHPSGLDVRPSDGVIAVGDIGSGRVEYFSGALNAVGSTTRANARDVTFQPDGNLAVGGPVVDLTVGSLFPLASVFRLMGFEAPRGQSLLAASNMALFQVLGQQFGGTGGSFNLPDLTPLPTRTGATVGWQMALEGDPADQDMLGQVGEVRLWAGTDLPRNWIPCDGAMVPADGFAELTEVIGTRFGGDGVTTIGIPALAELVPGVGFILCTEGIVSRATYPDNNYLGSLSQYAGPDTLEQWANVSGEEPFGLPLASNQSLNTLLGSTYGSQGETVVLPWLDPLDPLVPWFMPLASPFPPVVQ